MPAPDVPEGRETVGANQTEQRLEPRSAGFLLAFAPVTFAFVLAVEPAGAGGRIVEAFVGALAAVAVALQTAGALLGLRRQVRGARMVTVGWLLAVLVLAPGLWNRPLLAFGLGVTVLVLLAAAWGWLRTPWRRPAPAGEGVVGAFLGATAVAALSLLLGDRGIVASLPGIISATAVGGWAFALGARSGSRYRGLLLGPAVLPGTLAVLLRTAPEAAVLLSLLVVAPLALVAHRRGREARTGASGFDWSDLLFGDPARSLVLTFVLVGVLGGWLLALPISSTPEVGVGLLDAVFTSFSAVCVTGLTVLDTPVVWNRFGQAVVLMLIQIGGLGIMVFSVAGLTLLGRRPTLRHELAAAELLGETQGRLRGVLRQVFVVTFASEALGAAALLALFLRAGDPLWRALWRAVFTSISAFCNAGFALQTDSLVPYQRDPLVLLVVATLVTIGGLGPVVVVAVGARVLRRRLPLAARLVLATSAVLLALSFALILGAEWGGGLRDLPPFHRLTNALFQAVTLRTAGFNSVDLTAFGEATVAVMIVMMFVGGSPGSTAGGVKTTTIAVIALVLRAAARGESAPRAGAFVLGVQTVFRAASVAGVGLAAALGLVLALQLTQDMPLELTVFEAVSALGTVGLTIGGTPRLDEVGKVLVILGMLVGRVGPLTLFLFLAGRHQGDPTVRPERDVAVG